MEKTFVIIKPDAVQRGLTGEIMRRLEQRGLRLLAAKFFLVSGELARKHYAAHEGKIFYEGLISYITSAPVMAMVWQGPEAVAAAGPDYRGLVLFLDRPVYSLQPQREKLPRSHCHNGHLHALRLSGAREPHGALRQGEGS